MAKQIDNYDNVDSNEINTLDVGKYKDGSAKKVVSVVLAGCILIGTVVYGCTRKNKEENQDEEYQDEEYSLVLYCPTDVDTPEDVQKLIGEVNKNNEKDSVTSKTKLTERMVKYFNGKLTKEDFKGMNNDEIIDEIRNYSTQIYKILSPSITEYKNVKDGILELDKDQIEKEALAVALTLLDKDGYTYKTYASLYDGILNAQKNDIAMNNKGDYSSNSKNFGELTKKMLADKDVNIYEKALISISSQAVYVLFYDELTNELKEMFDYDFQGSYVTSASNDFYQKNGLITKVKYNDKKTANKTTTGEYKDAKDKADANQNKDKYIGTTKKEENTTKLVSKGGSPAKGSTGKSEVVSEATTEKKQEVVKPSTTRPPKKEEGGKPVGKPETTTKPSEKVTVEHKEPGTEPTTTAEEKKPVDDDGIEIYDPEEFKSAQKAAQINYFDADLAKGYSFIK